MKRVISVILALLAGILFPVLIWVALFVAVRKPLLHVLNRIGSTVLALILGIFFPVLLWVGFGVAAKYKMREWRLRRVSARSIGEILATAKLAIQCETDGGESMASAVFERRPMAEIRQILVRAGL